MISGLIVCANCLATVLFSMTGTSFSCVMGVKFICAWASPASSGRMHAANSGRRMELVPVKIISICRGCAGLIIDARGSAKMAGEPRGVSEPRDLSADSRVVTCKISRFGAERAFH